MANEWSQGQEMERHGDADGNVVAQMAVELPDGTFPTRLDDRGRLKLPVAFQRYFESLRERKLFVTTLDGLTVRIYPIDIWRHNRLQLAKAVGDNDAADVLFIANDLGANAEMDNQGRILIHEELRKALNLENQPLKLVPWQWRIDLYPEQVYEQRKLGALQNLAEKLRRLENMGLR